MISANNIEKSFGSLKVLRNVSLNIKKNEIVAIVGPSGAGKTTLLHILGTIEKPNSGTVTYDNVDVFTLSDKQLSTFRNRHIGFIFQFHYLLNEFSAIENVMLPALIAGISKKEAMQKALDLLSFLGLQDRINHRPVQLSGGEQQRVAVARALINNPSVVLADEPSGNLDSQNAIELHQLFLKLRKEFNQTFVIITHNLQLAQMSDRILEMIDGRIVN